jgi:hypothetical protein
MWGRDGPTYEDASFVEAPRRVVFARETDDWIVINIAFWTTVDAAWRILPECAIPNTEYLVRTREDRGRGLSDFGNPTNDFLCLTTRTKWGRCFAF